MISIIYNLLLFLLLPFLVPYHWYRSASRGRRTAFSERFGFVPTEDLARIAGHDCILVHAVSVGETNAAAPLLKALRRQYPDKKIVITNVTETGRSVALKSGLADLCLYFPFDYTFAVRRVLSQLRPQVIVIMETEIWPNFIAVARDLGIPVMLANGRISDRSLKRYLKLSWFFAPVLRRLSALCMQSGADAERIVAIGAASSTVVAAGNLKFDLPLAPRTPDQIAAVKEKFRIPAGVPVFTAASTHEGEEELAIAAYAELRKGREVFMVLAPRHPERAGAAAQLLSCAGVPFTLRSALEPSTATLPVGGVLLLDTVGELSSIFSASDLVFVGGSLVPTGGHNPLEPAACGLPVLFGPHMQNFREIAGLFLSSGAALEVADGAALTAAVQALADDPARGEAMGRRGEKLLQDNAGATVRHIEVVDRLLKGSAGAHGTGA